jgi:hypothetical protein
MWAADTDADEAEAGVPPPDPLPPSAGASTSQKTSALCVLLHPRKNEMEAKLSPKYYFLSVSISLQNQKI